MEGLPLPLVGRNSPGVPGTNTQHMADRLGEIYRKLIILGNMTAEASAVNSAHR
jgi:hypothetical protein